MELNTSNQKLVKEEQRVVKSILRDTSSLNAKSELIKKQVNFDVNVKKGEKKETAKKPDQ